MSLIDESFWDALQDEGVLLLPPGDVLETLRMIDRPITTTILDPWYNSGVGGVRNDYIEWLVLILTESARISDHIFLWGFPEIVYRVLNHIPEGLVFNTWLTWYYKNCPSVQRGWRSAQNACLHFSKPNAMIYPEHFLNEKQLRKQAEGKLRYIPGPTSVLEAPLEIGFVRKHEQTGHPAQKPTRVFEPLIKMTTKEGDVVLDPMCGSGTTGVVCESLGRKVILCDLEEEYVQLVERRLNITRWGAKQRIARKGTSKKVIQSIIE